MIGSVNGPTGWCGSTRTHLLDIMTDPKAYMHDSIHLKFNNIQSTGWKINPRFVREVDSGRGTLRMDCRGAPGVCMLRASASACLLSFIIFLKKAKQTSLVAQRLRLYAQNAGGPGSIPRATTKISSVLQQGFTIPYAATKTQCSLINKNKP